MFKEISYKEAIDFLNRQLFGVWRKNYNVKIFLRKSFLLPKKEYLT